MINVCMYGNLMTPTFVDRVGSKNKFIGVYFPPTTKLTAPLCLLPYPEVGRSKGAAWPVYKTLAARGGLPGTAVAFFRGALLMRRVSTLWIHTGNQLKIGIINDVTGNALLASILKVAYKP